MSTDQMQSGAGGTASPSLHPTLGALTGYAVGIPAQPDTGRLRRHLEACAICAAFVADVEEGEGRRLLDTSPAKLRAGALDFALAGLVRPTP